MPQLRHLSDFENWLYHAQDSNGQTYNTNLFAVVCQGSEGKLEEVTRALHAAFEAGKQVGLNTRGLVADE